MLPLRIDNHLYEEAKAIAKMEGCSISEQIEFWAKIGKAALDNPDLPVPFIRELLIAKNQDLKLAEPFVPEE